MTKSFINLVIAAATIASWCKASSPVEQCKGLHFDDLADRIKVDPCGSQMCKLEKLKNTTVAFKFNPKQKVEHLTNDVSATILFNIPLPFIGVTGQSACENVRRADTGESTPCPLEPGIEYIYENVFFIESFYPTVNLRVHWSLKDDTRDVICFEVPAAIVNGKTKNKKVKQDISNNKSTN